MHILPHGHIHVFFRLRVALSIDSPFFTCNPKIFHTHFKSVPVEFIYNESVSASSFPHVQSLILSGARHTSRMYLAVARSELSSHIPLKSRMVRDIAQIPALGYYSNLVQLKTGTKESGQRFCCIFIGNKWLTWKKIFVRLFEINIILKIPLRLSITGDVEVFFDNADSVIKFLLGNPPESTSCGSFLAGLRQLFPASESIQCSSPLWAEDCRVCWMAQNQLSQSREMHRAADTHSACQSLLEGYLVKFSILFADC